MTEEYYDVTRRHYKQELINRGQTEEQSEKLIELCGVPEQMLEVYRGYNTNDNRI